MRMTATVEMIETAVETSPTAMMTMAETMTTARTAGMI